MHCRFLPSEKSSKGLTDILLNTCKDISTFRKQTNNEINSLKKKQKNTESFISFQKGEKELEGKKLNHISTTHILCSTSFVFFTVS